MRKPTIVVLAWLCLPVALFASDRRSLSAAIESISQRELKGHASFLSSDAFEGREAGTQGGKAASIYLVTRLRRFEALKPAGERNSYYQEFGNDYRNVLALLPGSDPKLKSEFIVVGAHFDHVGYGARNNSFGPLGTIHNGADDNASGVAGVLEVADAFARLKPPPRRSVLFAFWDAEEKGLLGSENWVRRPTVPLKQVRMVWNLDMIGRLRKGNVEVHGGRSGEGLRRFMSENNTERGLLLDFAWDLPRESDHYPFIESAIPSVMLHTGKHRQYHRPSDDAHLLNVDGLQQMTRLTFQLAYRSAEADELPGFRRQALVEEEADRRKLTTALPAAPPRLGMSWSSRAAELGEIRAVAIDPNSPAARAGLRPGDRILSAGGVAIRGPRQFRQIVLAAASPMTLTVRRPNAARPIELTAALDGVPRRVGVSWSTDDAEPGSVILRRVAAGSPADLAGLKAGDRIYAVGGKPFRDGDEFRSRLAAGAGARLPLTMERKGNVREARLNLDLDRIDPAVARRPVLRRREGEKKK